MVVLCSVVGMNTWSLVFGVILNMLIKKFNSTNTIFYIYSMKNDSLFKIKITLTQKKKTFNHKRTFNHKTFNLCYFRV